MTNSTMSTDIARRGYVRPEVLVSTDWVAAHLNDANVRIVESNEDQLLYPSGHIPGAVQVDWAADLNDQVRRDYLDKRGFDALMSKIGATKDTTVVFYGDKSNWWACYAFWVFQLFGHTNARVMDGGRLKWEIRERDGSKCLVKTVDNKLFQRAFTFIGHPDTSNYTMQVDVLSDGVLRKVGEKEKILKMSEVGVLHQRYAIELKGAAQELEISSNSERLKHAVPFAWKPNVWYTLKTRVDVDAQGVGTIRGKAWKKGDAEPEAWSIELQHKTAHKNGAPGLFGFSPTDMPVYVDNISIVKSDAK